MLTERWARGPQRLPCDTLQRRVCGACRREGLAQELQHTLSPVRSARPGGGGGGKQLPGERRARPGPLTVRVSSMQRGICLLSKGNSSSPSLHTATSRAIVPDAAVATVTTSSQLPPPPLLLLPLPPPPSSCLQQPNPASVSTRRRAAHSPRGGGRGAGGHGRAGLRFPSPDSTRAQPISAEQDRDPPPRAARPPQPPPPPASSQGPKERRKGPGGPGASPARHRSPSSRTPPTAAAPLPTSCFPPPGSPQPPADPFLPFLGAPRPFSPQGCSCPARPRPWEGSTPPQLCGVCKGRLRPCPHPSRRRPVGSDLHRFRGRLPDPHLCSPLPADEARVRAGLGGSAAPNAVSSPGSVSRSRHGEWGREGGGRGEGGAGRGRELRAGHRLLSRDCRPPFPGLLFRNPVGGGGGVLPRVSRTRYRPPPPNLATQINPKWGCQEE